MKEPAPGRTIDQWLRLYRDWKNGNQTAPTQLDSELRHFFYTVVKKLSAGKTFGPSDRSDVAQNCFKKLSSLSPEQDFRGTTAQEFEAWLVKIVKHEYLNAVRHEKRQKRGDGQAIGQLPGESNGEITIAAETSTPSKGMIRQEEKKQFEVWLGQLPDNYQQVVRLRCADEKLTFAQIAERLNETEDTVKQWFHRAKERLIQMRRGQT
jgi:RNA polymerase sigma factor (sigma-70 family)